MPTFRGDVNVTDDKYIDNGNLFESDGGESGYVFRNLQIEFFRRGWYQNNFDNSIFQNIIIANMGWFTDVEGQGGVNTDLNGDGIVNYGDSNNNIYSDCAGYNHAFRFISIQDAETSLVQYNVAASWIDAGNPQDYYFHTTGTNNLFHHLEAYRMADSNHSGHGICFNQEAVGNVARDWKIVGTNAHLDGASHSYMHNGTLVAKPEFNAYVTNYRGGAFSIFDDSYNALLENITYENSVTGLTIWDQGSHTKPPVPPYEAGGNGIKMRYVTSTATTYPGISPTWYNMGVNFSSTKATVPVDNVSFENIQISGFDVFIDSYVVNNGLTLTNSCLTDVPTFETTNEGYSLDSSSTITNVNFNNSEVPTGFNISGTTTSVTCPYELAGYSVGAISGNTTEAGGTATFTVVLNTQPTTDVVFDVVSNDTGEGTVSPSTLTFTNANWDSAQTVTVTGVDDAIDDGDVVFTVTVSVNAAASDDDYDALADADVSVTNTDDDGSVVYITPDIQDPAESTSLMDTELVDRINNGWAHPAGGGYPDDEAYIIAQKDAFDANVEVGAWDNFNLDDGDTVVDAPIPQNGVGNQIFYAAKYAKLYNDSALAQKVMDRIVAYSQNASLDIAQKIIDNSYETRSVDTTPWLFMPAWFNKVHFALAEIKDLVNITQSDWDGVKQWLSNWNDLFKDNLDFSMDVTYGQGADWQAENYNLSDYNLLLATSGSRTNPPFTDSSGGTTAGEYYTVLGQQTGLNNVRCEMANTIHSYGVYFNDTDDINMAFAFFKAWLRFNFYPDLTSAELVRAFLGEEQLGINYVSVSFTAMGQMAIRHKIAGINGLTGISDGNLFLEWTTGQGTDDYANVGTGYVGTSTSGGSKSLLTAFKAHLDFMRQDGGQGWSPQRYFDGTTLMDGADRMNHRPTAAALNTYYQDAELEAGWKNDTSYGYRTPLTDGTGATGTGSYVEPNNGDHGAWYGLMYWADMILENVSVPGSVVKARGNRVNINGRSSKIISN
jgi:hypothetical protein